MVFDGKLQSYFGDDFSVLRIVDGSSFIEYPDGLTSCLRQEPFTVDEVTKLIFRISDVENYEKKNGMTSHILPTDAYQQCLTKNLLVESAQDKLSNNKRISKPRASIVIEEATKLRRDDPKMNKVKAKKRIDEILKDHKYNPYCRTQFNRLIKCLGFPPAPRGAKRAKTKK